MHFYSILKQTLKGPPRTELSGSQEARREKTAVSLGRQVFLQTLPCLVSLTNVDNRYLFHDRVQLLQNPPQCEAFDNISEL